MKYYCRTCNKHLEQLDTPGDQQNYDFTCPQCLNDEAKDLKSRASALLKSDFRLFT